MGAGAAIGAQHACLEMCLTISSAFRLTLQRTQNELSTQRGIELHSDNTDLSVIVQLDGDGLLHVHGKRHEPPDS